MLKNIKPSEFTEVLLEIDKEISNIDNNDLIAKASKGSLLEHESFIAFLTYSSDKSIKYVKTLLIYLIENKMSQQEFLDYYFHNKPIKNLAEKAIKLKKLNYIYSLYLTHLEIEKDSFKLTKTINLSSFDDILLQEILNAAFNKKEFNIVNTGVSNVMLDYSYNLFNGFVIKLFVAFYPKKIEGSMTYNNINIVHSLENNQFLEGVAIGIKQANTYLNHDFRLGTYFVWTNYPTIKKDGLSVTVGATFSAIISILKSQKNELAEPLQKRVYSCAFTGGPKDQEEVGKIISKVSYTNSLNEISEIFIPNKKEFKIFKELFSKKNLIEEIEKLDGEWNILKNEVKDYSEDELALFLLKLERKLKIFTSYEDIFNKFGL